MYRYCVLAVICLVAFAPGVLAQTTPDFELASIKPNRSGDGGYRIRTPPGGRFTGTNVTVKTLVLYGFDLKDFQLAGLPGWCDSERYDIEAHTGSSGVIDPEALRPLIRGLLASRFGLTTHRETKELLLYALVVAKNGPELHPNTGSPGHSTDWGRDHINAHAVSIPEFGHVLETQLDRAVKDETGIPGIFDFELKWTPEQSADLSGPSIFTALQEQYGLRLESKKGL